MARVSYPSKETASEETKAEWDRLRAARGTEPGNLYTLLGHSPKLMARWAAFAETVRGIDKDQSITLDARQRELTICQVARLAGADYEWGAHVVLARRAGVTQEQIDALLRDDLNAFSASERAMLSYVTESTLNFDVSDGTFEELKKHFNERQIVELAILVGFYNLVARVLVGLKMDLEPGRETIPGGKAKRR